MTEINDAPHAGGANNPGTPTLRLLSSLGNSPEARDVQPAARDEITTDAAVLEQAKGALMLRYGISSYLAFAALLRWAHEAETDLDTIARTLVQDICQGERIERSRPSLARWLEAQLRHNLPEDAWTR